MRKPIMAGIAGITLLTAGSVAVIVLATSERSRPAATPTSSPTPAPPTAPWSGASPAVLGLPTTAYTPPQVVVGPAPPPPPRGSWEAVPPVARPAALGKVGAAIGRELLALRPRLDACFDEETQARYGPRPHTVVKDVAPIEAGTTTILMLQIEEAHGAARIVDAPVESQGAASDGLVACVQQVLRGRVVEVPEARAGARHRLLYTLTR